MIRLWFLTCSLFLTCLTNSLNPYCDVLSYRIFPDSDFMIVLLLGLIALDPLV
jgi:hypothetical protein